MDEQMELSSVVRADYFGGHGKGMASAHNHTYYEISVVQSGKLRVTSNGETVSCEAPCVLLHFPGAFHRVEVEFETVYKRYNIVFSANVFRSRSELLSDVKTLFVSPFAVFRPTDEEINEIIYYMTPCVESGGREDEVEKRTRILSVILHLLSNSEGFADIRHGKQSTDYINRAVSVISEKLSPSITAAEIAAELSVSRSKLTADFKRGTGMTVKEYIELQCVERAKRMLTEGYSVQFCADELGYVDVGTFIRMFKKVTGVTPGRYGKGEK